MIEEIIGSMQDKHTYYFIEKKIMQLNGEIH